MQSYENNNRRRARERKRANTFIQWEVVWMSLGLDFFFLSVAPTLAFVLPRFHFIEQKCVSICALVHNLFCILNHALIIHSLCLAFAVFFLRSTFIFGLGYCCFQVAAAKCKIWIFSALILPQNFRNILKF